MAPSKKLSRAILEIVSLSKDFNHLPDFSGIILESFSKIARASRPKKVPREFSASIAFS